MAAASTTHPASAPLPARLRPARRAFRSAVAVASLLLVVAAAALPHCREIAEPGHERALRAISVADAALHPAAPAHVESSGTRLHPPCVACLLQARTPSLQAAAASVALAMRHLPTLLLHRAAWSSRAAVRLGPARASPRSASLQPSAL